MSRLTTTLSTEASSATGARPVTRSTAHARPVAAAALVGCGVLAALLLVVPGTINVLDGQSMFGVTRSIVERGDVTVYGPTYGVPGLHGRWYSKYGPGQSALAVPLYLAGRAIAQLVPPGYRPELPMMAASLLPALATALTSAMLVLAAFELGFGRRFALVLAVIYAVATPAAVYATQWFSEPVVACASVTAFWLLVRDRPKPTVWRPLLAGCALAIAAATRLDAVLLAVPFLIYTALPADRRGARLAAILLPLIVSVAGLGLYNEARFGSPFTTGYAAGNAFDRRDMHSLHGLGSVIDGLYGLLISPGKGLLEYAPPVLLAPVGALVLWSWRRAETLLLLALILIELVAHANVLIRWVGGWSWGPRFLLPVLPFIVLLLAPLFSASHHSARGSPRNSGGPVKFDPVGPHIRRGQVLGAAVIVLALLGVAVQAPALAVDEPHTYIYTLEPRYHAAGPSPSVQTITDLELAYINQPDLSPIIGSWRLLGRAGIWSPPSDVSPALVAQKSVTVAPHTWWRLLALQGVPAPALIEACAAMGLIAVLCFVAAMRTTAEGRSATYGGSRVGQILEP